MLLLLLCSFVRDVVNAGGCRRGDLGRTLLFSSVRAAALSERCSAAAPPVCRFNFEGCRFGDLVSHYVRPKQMLCMWGKQGQCRGCERAGDV